MARHVEFIHEAMNPIEGIFLVLFTFLFMGALLLCMARTKRTAPDSSQLEEPSNRKRNEEGSSGDRNEQRKKARNEARVQLIQEKNVTNERHLDHISLGPRNEVFRLIEAHGMRFWFEPVDGYNLYLCREFYQTLRAVEVNEVEILRTNVRGKMFEVTPNIIATLLGDYERPPSSMPVYPHNVTQAKTSAKLVALIYDDPSQFKGIVHVGGLKHLYELLNKLLHYNLILRGAEKTPNLEKLALLDAIMPRKTIDFALFVWEVMKDFAETYKPKANLPFRSLVTRMCRHFKVKADAFDKLTPPKTGAIGKTSSKKRKAMSRGERARAPRQESEALGPSSSAPAAEPSIPGSPSAGPSTAAPKCSIPQCLDALEVTMHALEVSVHGISAMMTELFMHTFPGRPVPTGPL